jgi:hypothetical protein
VEDRDERPHLAPGGEPGPLYAGISVPGAGEAREARAAAVSVRGEHRTDAAGRAVDVGADDDRVRLDATEHCVARSARQRLDGETKTLRRITVPPSHRAMDSAMDPAKSSPEMVRHGRLQGA